MNFREIIEEPEVLVYLEGRQLTERYRKAKRRLLTGQLSGLDFKKRQPHSTEIWTFRISKKYRARCYFRRAMLVVFEIDNHQN